MNEFRIRLVSYENGSLRNNLEECDSKVVLECICFKNEYREQRHVDKNGLGH